jgi:hypothetical protein
MSSLGGALGALGGSGNIGSAVVKLYLDSSQYQEQLAAAKDETVATTDEAGATTSKFSGIATAAYATAGIAALSFAKSAIDASEQHAQAIAALTAQVGTNAQAFEDQAHALQNVSGVQDELILGADTILSRFKLSTAQVQQAIPTVLDYARATGKSVPDAATAVGRALLGNTRALKAVGISYTSTGNSAQDFTNILDLLNSKVGGQAAAFADTYAGKLDILTAKFHDLKEEVGSGIVTQLEGLVTTANNTSDATTKLTGQSNLLGDAFHTVLVDANPLIVSLRYSEAYLNAVAKAAGVTSQNTDGLTQSLGAATTATSNWGDNVQNAATQQANLATNTKAATRAIQAQRLATLQAAGGLLGLVSQLQTTQQDQAALNKMQEQGKTNTAAYRAEVIQATTDQLAFRTAVRQYVADNPNRSYSQTVDALKEMATQAGVTGQQFKAALGGPIKDVTTSLDNLRSKRVSLNVDSSQVDTAIQKLHQLQDLANQHRI